MLDQGQDRQSLLDAKKCHHVWQLAREHVNSFKITTV